MQSCVTDSNFKGKSRDPEKKRLYNKAYHEKHKEEIARRKHEYYLMMRAKNFGQELPGHKRWRLRHPHYQTEHARKIRNLLLDKLGSKCANCGNADRRVLCVDHINNGGTKERKKISATALFRRLLKLSEDELKNNYQLLCANCNMIKEWQRPIPWRADGIGRKPIAEVKRKRKE